MAAGPSAHLTWGELACHDGTAYPAPWRLTIAVDLAREFERIRERCGAQPLKVLSGYRTKSWNKRVGGKVHSLHIVGRALDLETPAWMSFDHFLATINECAAEPDSKIRGIGVYHPQKRNATTWTKGFVHIDIREGARFSRWVGSRPFADAPGPNNDAPNGWST